MGQKAISIADVELTQAQSTKNVAIDFGLVGQTITKVYIICTATAYTSGTVTVFDEVIGSGSAKQIMLLKRSYQEIEYKFTGGGSQSVTVTTTAFA